MGEQCGTADGFEPPFQIEWGDGPDVLAERLQKDSERKVEIGVLNEGIIGNRLLHDSPKVAGNPFGAALGEHRGGP